MILKSMKRHLAAYLLLATLLLTSFQIGQQSVTFASPALQSECVKQIIGNAEIVANQAIDVDQDGKQDQVVLYGKDYVDILVALNRSQEHCEVVLNERFTDLILTSPVAWRTAKVRKIEMIELTGDDKPELHISLEKSGGGAAPHYEYALHTIYTFKDGRWQEALNVGLCLAFNSFEFRDGPDEGVKDIYLDEDRDCDPPWSSQRTYTIMRWDGSRFMPSESGTIEISTTSPSWMNMFCIISFVSIVVISGITVIFFIRMRQNSLS